MSHSWTPEEERVIERWMQRREDAATGKYPYSTQLSFKQFKHHRVTGDSYLYEAGNLGSGLTTNSGMDLIAWNEVNNGLTVPSLNNMKFQQIGTGATGAAASDVFLQTAQGTTNLSGTTNGYMTGTNTVVAPNIIQSVATFTATGAIAVTEWILANANSAAVAATETGTPTSTTFPDSGATFATAGTGLKGFTIQIHASPMVNTPTTTVMGLITANTSTLLTIAEGWWTLVNATASTPSATSAYIIQPTAIDHKVFSAVNLASTDTLQFTYQLTATSGT